MWIREFVKEIGHHLPRGWSDLGRQLVIWFGFALLYQLVRGLVNHHPKYVAVAHGRKVLHIETHFFHRFYELIFERFAIHHQILEWAVSLTYWNSEFTVLGLALFWVYLNHHYIFNAFRNSVLLANVIGLFGYFFWPTAPPRLLGLGFINHSLHTLALVTNQYAAMPSLHVADALIVSAFLVTICNHLWTKILWAIWPAWVIFSVMATGNHYWLDCLAGLLVAIAAIAVINWTPRLNREQYI